MRFQNNIKLHTKILNKRTKYFERYIFSKNIITQQRNFTKDSLFKSWRFTRALDHTETAKNCVLNKITLLGKAG